MASSSSSSSIILESKYDVFLSFRGEDTRLNFTSHLYAALCRKQILTFIDDEGLNRGDEISPTLLKAIEDSKISVIIFSKDYASSRWCLDELEMILECKDKKGQMIIPVFYHIDPSDVRKQAGSFNEAFVKHEEHFKEVRDKVQKWRIALTKAANLSGWDSSKFRSESKLVVEIVEDISKKLKNMSTSNDCEGLIGLDSRIEEITSLLCVELLDFRAVGIWGMGGIGKTTLANVVYNQVSSQFEGHCFITNVREESERHGIFHMRDQVISQLLGENIKISTPSIPQYIQERIQRKRVFIVLDDVNTIAQLEVLVRRPQQFGQGSKIIITTRDKHLLRYFGVHYIYEVVELDHNESCQLFCINAFKLNHPLEDFGGLANMVIGYAKGNPLALKVLGSALYGRSKKDWESAAYNLKKIGNKEIQDVLKISYELLSKEEKKIFLDIACFFKGENRTYVTNQLDGCYNFSTHFCITTLIDKALISESYGMYLEMHDLIQKMAQEIVCQESDKKVEKRSRLWDHEDIYPVLVDNKGTDSIEGISLNMSKIGDLPISPRAFIEMTNLRFLKFYYSEFYEDTVDISKVQLPRTLEYLPNELRYLHWDGYPLKKLPSKFSLENIVELKLRNSKLKQLWKGKKHPSKLKFIDLSHSKYLTGIPDLSNVIGLEVINLYKCRSLVEVHSSVGSLNQLHKLDLRGCESFRKFSGNIHFRSHITLDLSYCIKLKKFPQILGNIKYLYLRETAIEKVPPSIACLTALIVLDMEGCRKLKCLTTNICKLKFLEKLNLSYCSKLKSFPEILEQMECLQTLQLHGATAIKELPSSIEYLNGLVDLELRDCRNLEGIPRSISNLTSLRKIDISGCLKVGKLLENLENCVNFEEFCASKTAISEISIATCWRKITRLTLAFCKLTEIPEDLCCMSSLQELYLSGNSFKSLPATIKKVSQLKVLHLNNCDMLESFPELSSYLMILEAIDCKQLRSLPRLTASQEKGDHVFNCWKHKFLFINRYKLNENEYNKILIDAQQLIQDMAIASLTIDFKMFRGKNLATIFLPGSKIPDWISYQSLEGFLTIDLSQYWSYRRFLGFALAFVIGVEESTYLHNIIVECVVDFESKFDKFSQNGSFSYLCPSVHKVLIDSNFVVLGHFPYHFERIISGEYKTVSFRFSPICLDQNCNVNVEVKSCGACPIYEQSSQAQPNISIEELATSSRDFEEIEDDTKHKRKQAQHI